MPATALVQTRIDPAVKERAAAVLEELDRKSVERFARRMVPRQSAGSVERSSPRHPAQEGGSAFR